VKHCAKTRAWSRLSWTCALLLVLLSAAQSAHVCELGDPVRAPSGGLAQISSFRGAHVFCAICASAHSPSLAAALVSLPSIDTPAEAPIQGRALGRSVARDFALYIRPPPIS